MHFWRYLLLYVRNCAFMAVGEIAVVVAQKFQARMLVHVK